MTEETNSWGFFAQFGTSPWSVDAIRPMAVYVVLWALDSLLWIRPSAEKEDCTMVELMASGSIRQRNLTILSPRFAREENASLPTVVRKKGSKKSIENFARIKIWVRARSRPVSVWLLTRPSPSWGLLVPILFGLPLYHLHSHLSFHHKETHQERLLLKSRQKKRTVVTPSSSSSAPYSARSISLSMRRITPVNLWPVTSNWDCLGRFPL